MRGSDDRATHAGRNLVAGGITGCVAKSFVAPFDRVKILLQGGHQQFAHSGIIQSAQYIYRNEGVAAFWRGNKAQMLRIFPYAGIHTLGMAVPLKITVF